MAGKRLKNAEIRRSRGRTRDEAIFPVAPPKSDLPDDYMEVLGRIKERVRQERLRVVLAANTVMTIMYWDIGNLILERQKQAGWGAKVIDRLASDLRSSFPEQKGFSPRNLKYMRSFAASWPERSIVQEVLAQIPWYHNIALLEKLETSEDRLWYAHQAFKQGWSHNILVIQIESKLIERQGKAVSNFRSTLPPLESDMAEQIFKDPYLFDFLGTADPRREAEVEEVLVRHIEKFLLELGSGFAFVGRQVHLEVGTQDYYIDLLFYHLKLRCYVVIELKAVPFEPGFVGQINLYLSAVDDLLRHPEDKPSIGLLLCRSKNRLTVEYALRGLSQSIGVADWKDQLIEKLPKNLEASLPTIEQLEAELARLEVRDE